jgi:hypothetical protein
MKIGDTVRATWSDGLIMTGKYVGTERGYVILMSEGNKIVCNTSSVKFEVINETA